MPYTKRPLSLAPAVNFHMLAACNARCRFCFATFPEVSGVLSLADAQRIVEIVRQAGAQKINFVGGEPTLDPRLPSLVLHAKSLGLTTSVVTNGFRLDRVLDACGPALDWVGLSVDTPRPDVSHALGRGAAVPQRALRLSERLRKLGIRIKLNTVVTRLTVEDDMVAYVRLLRPMRWKVFQVLRIDGENESAVASLAVTDAEFEAFVARHVGRLPTGVDLVAESSAAMRSSYVMIDPKGRLFGNATGRHRFSASLLETDVAAALSHVGFDPAKLVDRGGIYAW